jgi:hypothetical protein
VLTNKEWKGEIKMRMSTYVVGIKPPDSKWVKMKEAYEACKVADIDIPEEIQSFFVGELPDEKGVVVELRKSPACSRYSENSSEGIEIDLTKLPKDIKIIRFVNSW